MMTSDIEALELLPAELGGAGFIVVCSATCGYGSCGASCALTCTLTS